MEAISAFNQEIVTSHGDIRHHVEQATENNIKQFRRELTEVEVARGNRQKVGFKGFNPGDFQFFELERHVEDNEATLDNMCFVCYS